MSRAGARRMRIAPGAWVAIQGRRYCIREVLDLETVVVQAAETGVTRHAKIHMLQPCESTPETPSETVVAELADIEAKDWQRARERFAIIQPFLDDPDCTRDKIHARAASVGRHPATLYRWLQYYRHNGQLSTLAPAKPGVRRGHSRLAPEVETILTATIDEFYLHGQKRSAQHTYQEVARRCRNAGLQRPHPHTVRNRIRAVSDQEKLRRREGGKAMRDRYAPIPGAFPDFLSALIRRVPWRLVSVWPTPFCPRTLGSPGTILPRPGRWGGCWIPCTRIMPKSSAAVCSARRVRNTG